MKKLISLILLLLVLAGCQSPAEETIPTTTAPAVTTLATEEPTEATTEAPVETTVPATEPVVQALEEELPFVRVTDVIPGVQQNLLFSQANTLTGQPLYDHTDAWLRKGTADKLAAACAELNKLGYGLVIWDAYQPVSAQQALTQLYPDFAWDDAGCRGSAVDVCLVDLVTGREIAIPSEYTDLSDASDRVYQNCPLEAMENAALLEEVMLESGFRADPNRWWRFIDTTEYPIEESFDPAAPSRWAGKEEITLLESPAEGSQALCSISAGEDMTLLAFQGSYALVEYGENRGYVQVSAITPLAPKLWTANENQEQLVLYRNPDVGSAARATIEEGESCELIGWNFKFAEVSFEGKTGFVRAFYIQPTDEEAFDKTLDTVELTATYTYDAMMEDLNWFALRYPDIATVEVIGQSEMGLDIPVLRIGSEDAQYHVLFQAAIHGREHMTAWLAMALVDYWLDHNVAAYGDVCYHIIPMSNPDGVNISQTATLTEEQKDIYRQDWRFGNTTENMPTYATHWKANALGVDLNQNFDAEWEKAARRSKPSSMRYKGESVFCASEARALRDYTLRYDFDVTISYHSEGSIIYYNYGDKQPVNDQCESLALHVSAFTGYDLKFTNSCGGYKDWAIDDLEIPSLTIETGSYDPPLKLDDAYNIFFRNMQILPELARWIQALESEK